MDEDSKLTPPDEKDGKNDETLMLGGSGKLPQRPSKPLPGLSSPIGNTDSTLVEGDDGQTIPNMPPIPHLSTRLTDIDGKERYKIEREFARGGMGRILLAYDASIGRQIALKETLQPTSRPSSSIRKSGTGLSPEEVSVERFLREAKVTGRLEHPNIVPVYEIGERHDGRSYYTMRFVPGQTLSEKLKAIREDETLTPDQQYAKRIGLLDSFVDICNAIAYAHSRGVIHRDLKPQNVIIGEFGETVLIDWGLARVEGEMDHHAETINESQHRVSAAREGDSSLTLEGSVIGTPAYMPPEQAEGKIAEVNERSDVYALGAILYEILSGEAPYRGPSAYAILAMVLDNPPIPMANHYPSIPAELTNLVEQAMARKPSQRLASAAALAEEVRAFRDGRTLSSYSYSGREHFMRFLRRNRAVVATVLLALIALVGLGAMAYVNVSREKDTALEAQSRAEASEAKEKASADVALAAQRDAEAALEKASASEKRAKRAFELSETNRIAATKALSDSEKSLRHAKETRARAHLRESRASMKRLAHHEALMQRAAAIEVSPNKEDKVILAGLASLTPPLLWQTPVSDHVESANALVIGPSGRFMALTTFEEIAVVDGYLDRVVARYPFTSQSQTFLFWEDQQTLLVGDSSGKVTRVDLRKTGTEALSALGNVGSHQFGYLSRDRRTLAVSANAGSSLSFYRLEGEELQLIATHERDSGDDGDIWLSPNGATFLWKRGNALMKGLTEDSTKSSLLFQFVEEYPQPSPVFSPQGDKVAISSSKQVVVLSTEDGSETRIEGLNGSPLLWPESNMLLVSDWDKLIRVDPSEPSNKPTVTEVENGGWWGSPVLCKDGVHIAVLEDHLHGKSSIKLVNIDSGAVISRESDPDFFSDRIHVTRNGRWMVWSGIDSNIVLLDTSNGEIRTVNPSDGGFDSIQSWVVSPNSDSIYAVTNTGIFEYSIESGTTTQLPELSANPPEWITISPDGAWLLGSIRNWAKQEVNFARYQIAEKTWKIGPSQASKESIKELSIDPDGRGFKVRFYAGSDRWGNADSLELLPNSWPTRDQKFMPNMNELSIESSGATLTMRPTFPFGKATARKIETGLQSIDNFVVSGDGRVAALWNNEDQVVLVDLLASQPLTRLDLRSERQDGSDLLIPDAYTYSEFGISSLALSFDASRLYCVSFDRSIRAYDLSSLPFSEGALLSEETSSIYDLYFSLLSPEGQAYQKDLPSFLHAWWGPNPDEIVMIPSTWSFDEGKGHAINVVSLSEKRYLRTIGRIQGFNAFASHISSDRREIVIVGNRSDKKDSKKNLLVQLRIHFDNQGKATAREIESYGPYGQNAELLDDGSLIVVAKGMQVFRLAQDGSIDQILAPNEEEYTYPTLVISGDSKRFGLLFRGVLQVADSRNGKSIAIIKGLPNFGHAFLSENGEVALVGQGNKVRALRLSDQKELWAKEKESHLDLRRMPNDSVMIRTVSGRCDIVDVVSGEIRSSFQAQHLASFHSFDMSQDSSTLLLSSGQYFHTFDLKGALEGVKAIKRLPEKDLLDWAGRLGGRELKDFRSSAIRIQKENTELFDRALLPKVFGKEPLWPQNHRKPKPQPASAQVQALLEETRRKHSLIFEAPPARLLSSKHSMERLKAILGSLDYIPPEKFKAAQWLVSFPNPDPELRLMVARALLQSMQWEDSRSVKEERLKGIQEFVELANDPTQRAMIRLVEAKALHYLYQTDQAVQLLQDTIPMLDDLPEMQLNARYEVLNLLLHAAKFDSFKETLAETKPHLKQGEFETFSALVATYSKAMAELKHLELELPKLIVDSIEDSSHAAKAGLKENDMIVSVAGIEVFKDFYEVWNKAIEANPRAAMLDCKVIRGGKATIVSLPAADYFDVETTTLITPEIGQSLEIRKEALKAFNLANGTKDNPEARRNHFKRAIELFQQELKIAPSFVAANRLGVALYSLQRYEESLQAFQKALLHAKGSESDYINNHGYIGYALGELGRYQEAVQQLESMIKDGVHLGYVYQGALHYAINGAYYEKAKQLQTSYDSIEWQSPSPQLANTKRRLKMMLSAQKQAPSFPCLVVASVNLLSNEAEGGLKQGDIITHLQSQAVSTQQQVNLFTLKLDAAAGKTTTWRVIREDEELELKIVAPARWKFRTYSCQQGKAWPTKGSQD